MVAGASQHVVFRVWPTSTLSLGTLFKAARIDPILAPTASGKDVVGRGRVSQK
jgi:hypothetical protein